MDRRGVALVWFAFGIACAAASASDLPHVFAYHEGFPFATSEWRFGLFASGVGLTLAAGALVGGAMELAGKRAPLWLVAPSLAAFLLLALPLAFFPRAAFDAQFVAYTIVFPWAWPFAGLAAFVAWYVARAIRRAGERA